MMNSVNSSVPGTQELRSFGLIMAVFIVLIFGLFMPWVMSWNTGYIPWVLSLLFVVMALLLPAFLAPVYAAWMKIGGVLGRINTFIILLLVYILLFIPMGIILKLCRYDPLQRRFDPNQESYRVVREANLDKSSLENPF